MPTKKTSAALTESACILFAVTADKIPAVLWALKIRQTCSRCGGTGKFSFNLRDGSRCFGCAGKGEQSAPLTLATLAMAQGKVRAGELDAIRVRNRARMAAKKEIAPLVARAELAYQVIADQYTAASKANAIGRPLFLAQSVNNDIRWGVHTGSPRYKVNVADIAHEVKSGYRTDYPRCVSELQDCIAMLESLSAAFTAFCAGSGPFVV